MPASSPFHSTVAPYPVRVDNFTNNLPTDLRVALHLLTHAHSDHIIGLNSPDFSSRVLCSADTKRILLNTEPFQERDKFDRGLIPQRTRPYAHLNVRRDLLMPLSLNVAHTFEFNDNETVAITLVDANHCPGSVMFLVEGNKGAILHTGDVRAEPCWIQNVSKHPSFQPYLVNPAESSTAISKVLEAIYLDTSSVFGTDDVPGKSEAAADLLSLMHCFPLDTIFFINCWTWGWEELLKAIADSFQVKIHVDRYKKTMHSRLSDVMLKNILTTEPSKTRFHACERFARCDQASDAKNNVVYVNPVVMSKDEWGDYVKKTKKQLDGSVFPQSLMVSMSRHSCLSELQALVSLFRPKKIVPNDLCDELQGVDWACMIAMFAEQCQEGAADLMWKDITSAFPQVTSLIDQEFGLEIPVLEELDIALKQAVSSNEETDLASDHKAHARRRRRDKLAQLLRKTTGILTDLCTPGFDGDAEDDSQHCYDNRYDTQNSSELDDNESHEQFHELFFRCDPPFPRSNTSNVCPPSPTERHVLPESSSTVGVSSRACRFAHSNKRARVLNNHEESIFLTAECARSSQSGLKSGEGPDADVRKEKRARRDYHGTQEVDAPISCDVDDQISTAKPRQIEEFDTEL